MPASDVTVTAQWADLPSHTAHFSVNGTIDNNNDCTVAEGVAIIFPSDPVAISGKSFVGWITETIDGTTNTAPSFVTSATMGSSDITYYACFAEVDGSSETKQDELTSSVTGITTSSYSNFSNKSVSGGSSAVYAGNCAGSSSYIQLRTSSNTGLVSTTSGGKAKKVTVEWSSTTDRALQVYGSNTAYTGLSDIFDDNKKGTLLGTLTYGSDTELTITGNYAYIGIKPDANKSGASQLSTITIDWEISSITYSDYCTTVIAAAVEKPEITVAENPFQFSTTATITCDTENAAIKYSFDGETWNDYSEDLTITSTTTIYAKAEKDGDVSAIASVTATKKLVETLVSINDTEITNDAVNINNGEAGSLLAFVAAYNADEEDYDEIDGKTVTWSSDDDEIATINPRTGEVTLTGTGEVTFTATYAGDDYYEGSTATYPLTVVNRYDVTLPADDDYGTYEMDVVYNPVAVGEEVTLTYTPAPSYENYQATWSVNGTPISGNKFTMPAEAVTVTVSIKDYATLPFNWEGGARSDLTSITGVTANGLGGDYASGNSPYLVKFDTDGDYILIKTDSQPGKVTIGVKMIGGGDTSSITVQGSSDGTNFTDVATLTISGSQYDVLSLETSNSFAATDRYVRLLFTKGSNVGVGPITIAIPSADPVINASNVELACDATSGEIAYSISNPVQGVSLSAASNDSWISNVTVDAENSKVTFVTTANTGDQRSGSITLSYTGADNRVVTVTQARYTVNATYTLITSVDDITPGKHYVIASSNNDGVAKVMGAQSSTDNNRVAVSGATIATINNEKVLTVSNEYEFVFYGPDANGNYTICDANTSGYLYVPTAIGNFLRTQDTNDANGKWRIELDDERNDGTMIIASQNSKDENVMQYNSSSSLFSCYDPYTQAPVYLYEKNNDDQVVTTTVSVTLNAYGYATFASTSALDFLDADAAGYSAWQIYDISGETITFIQIDNHVEPGTGILLKGTANGTAKINLLPAGGKELDYNKLEGVTADKTISDGEYYGLSGNQFVKVNGGTVKAGKALLPANKVPSGARLTFVFEDAQGIKTIEHSPLTIDDSVYNLSGQRVTTPKKGLYIVNGKKVVMK